MKKNLNEQTSRIKQMMGLLKEATTTPDEKIAYDFYSGAYGPGSDLYGMGEALKKITSTAQFAIVNASVKKQSGKLDIAGIINDECEGDDTKSIKAFIAILAKIGITASATFTKEGGYYTPFTFKIATPAVPAASTLTTTGWWDKFPSLVAFKDDKTKTKVIHYPKVEQASNGYIYFELTKTPGTYWAFLPTSWVQFDGFENVANPEHKGTWKDENGVLKIIASDGTSYDTASGEWTKAKPKAQWKPETGQFPLMVGQYGKTIQTLQKALGMKGDSYFGPVTEKMILTKAPEYKKETGVTQEIYNKIVSNTAVSKDLKTTYDMNTQAGKDAYLQQGLKNTTAINPAAKYSQITPQQQANADALKSGQPLPKQ